MRTPEQIKSALKKSTWEKDYQTIEELQLEVLLDIREILILQSNRR